MRKVIAFLVTSLALGAGSWWAFTRGADFEFRNYSPSERAQLLDTTTTGEQWMLAGCMMAALAVVAILLAAAAYFRVRKKAVA